MPKEYKREHYILKSYDNERYKLVVIDEESNFDTEEYANDWEALYMKAKDLTEKGKKCEIWSLLYEFE